jgi:hypothetical protein
MSYLMALPLRSVVEEKRDGVVVYQERRYAEQGWREQRSFKLIFLASESYRLEAATQLHG